MGKFVSENEEETTVKSLIFIFLFQNNRYHARNKGFDAIKLKKKSLFDIWLRTQCAMGKFVTKNYEEITVKSLHFNFFLSSEKTGLCQEHRLSCSKIRKKAFKVSLRYSCGHIVPLKFMPKN